MVERRSKSKAGDTCSVEDCSEPRKRSIPVKKIKKALSDMKLSVGTGRAHLCKKHYKEYKKATKSDRTFDRLGLRSGN